MPNALRSRECPCVPSVGGGSTRARLACVCAGARGSPGMSLHLRALGEGCGDEGGAAAPAAAAATRRRQQQGCPSHGEACALQAERSTFRARGVKCHFCILFQRAGALYKAGWARSSARALRVSDTICRNSTCYPAAQTRLPPLRYSTTTVTAHLGVQMAAHVDVNSYKGPRLLSHVPEKMYVPN